MFQMVNGTVALNVKCQYTHISKGKGKRKVVADALADHKRDYALMIMWRGLNQRIRKDTIRENDGERMIRHWKFDMLQFFEKNHPKYFLQGQQLLSACNGAVSPRLKHTIIWNRTVNTRGGKGNNIAMDLHMEHLNNEYKASVKDSGTLTADTIARHSQMVGIGKAIRNVYKLKLSDGHTRTHRKAVVDRSKDLKTFVEMMYFERIFENNPGRRHSAFQDFKFEILQNVNPKKVECSTCSPEKRIIKKSEDN
ncbi:hypothetical protein FSP39_017544 [Pinctada imbricata]|uniref:DUF6589 domain-containing protein n=1 Tax=Pinctada imbricata TaxID=66713 RepID=A0AA88YV07_PINIB|nr:hypothetical protein FSP39_017544 [Pinctada imbricata]